MEFKFLVLVQVLQPLLQIQEFTEINYLYIGSLYSIGVAPLEALESVTSGL